MNSKNIAITDAELSKACDHISKQFAAHSWWPCEQPGEAKREFDLMKGSTTALNIWCERWLDTGQCQKLEKALRSSPFQHGKSPKMGNVLRWFMTFFLSRGYKYVTARPPSVPFLVDAAFAHHFSRSGSCENKRDTNAHRAG
jgi:hypothetical protein